MDSYFISLQRAKRHNTKEKFERSVRKETEMEKRTKRKRNIKK